MSILIKGMEMPKNCGECWLYEVTKDMVSGEVLFLCKCRDVIVNNPYTTKDKGCPLVEIPTPHGRLIDKDKLRHDLFVNFNGERIPFYDYDNFPTKITYRDLHSILSEQKTIIEAEGSEE